VADTRQSPREDRRAAIVRAAAACLNERGISQSTLSTIASRVGVSRAALYYYVTDQQDLVFQCYQAACASMESRLRDASRQRSALQAIETVIDGMVRSGDPEIAVLSEIAYLRPDQREVVFKLHKDVMARLAEILSAGAARGEIRSLRVEVVAQAILGLVSWSPLAKRWPTTTNVPDADLADAIKSLCIRGLAADRTLEFDYQPFDLRTPALALRSLFDNDLLTQAKQEAVLTAASWNFNRKGIEATSLDEIALTLGVTPKVIYHNVGDKETLVTGCYRRAFEFYVSLADRADRAPTSRLQAICAVAHALAEATLRDDLSPLTPLAGIESMPRRAQKEITEMSARLLAIHTRMCEQGQAEGSLRPFNVRALLSIRHATHEWLPKWYGEADPALVAEIPGELVAFTRLGLSPTT
jgi:AcrR family transcriptional regulator